MSGSCTDKRQIVVVCQPTLGVNQCCARLKKTYIQYKSLINILLSDGRLKVGRLEETQEQLVNQLKPIK